MTYSFTGNPNDGQHLGGGVNAMAARTRVGESPPVFARDSNPLSLICQTTAVIWHQFFIKKVFNIKL